MTTSPKPVFSDRLAYLLEEAADALEDGRDPFADGFLIEHSVTLDECYSLSDLLSASARMMLLISHTTPDPKGE